ncbi:MAG: hypothetical protein J7L96_01075 [Bacteroidales bacterium]|nr:hypothetical protein [Bacteroidales bacterium]
MLEKKKVIIESFCLGGLTISIHNRTSAILEHENPYKNFIGQSIAKADFKMHIFSKLPIIIDNPESTLMVPMVHTTPSGRCIPTNKSWKIIVYPGYTMFEIPHPNQVDIIKMRLANNADDRTILIETGNASVFPVLPYPLDILLLYHLGQWFDFLIIHGAGFSIDDYGFLCLGRSGAGKSTISQLAKNAHEQLVQDDRIILQKTSSGWVMYPVPLQARDKPVKSRLNKIYNLYHGQQNSSIPVYGDRRINHFLPHLIQFPSWPRAYEHSLSLVKQLLDQISISSLFFKPDQSIIHYLQDATTRSETYKLPLTKPLSGKIQSHRNQHDTSNISR